MTLKIICHGGVSRKSPNIEAKQRVVEHAAAVGMHALTERKSAVEAVVEAVTILEDSPLCNAGTGSFVQMDGNVRMDAAIMDEDLNIGAVIQIQDVKNPIQVARSIHKQSVHSILSGELASEWAHKNNHAYYDPRTEDKILLWLEQWKRFRHSDTSEMVFALREEVKSSEMLGTVGAVALDDQGCLAAGTSTGGLKIDLPGRVGDVALIGCGTYCNKFAGISCTGVGEKIIKAVLANSIADAIEYGKGLDEALAIGLTKMEQVKGRAGFIAITKDGHVGSAHNCETMAVASLEES